MEIYPDRDMPEFKRLIPNGSVSVDGETYTKWSGEDFNLSDKSYLVVSEKALDILNEHNIENCDLYKLSKI